MRGTRRDRYAMPGAGTTTSWGRSTNKGNTRNNPLHLLILPKAGGYEPIDSWRKGCLVNGVEDTRFCEIEREKATISTTVVDKV